MIELQVPTLWTWLVLSEFFMAALLAVVWNLRRNELALVYWVLASICLGLGATGVGLYGRWPDGLSLSVASTLVGLAWSLRWAGLRQFAGQTVRVAAYLLPPLMLGVLVQLGGPLGLETHAILWLLTGMGIAYALMLMADAWRAQRLEPLLMRRILISVSSLAVLLQCLVMGLAMESAPGGPWFAQSQPHALALLGLLAVSGLLGFGCLLMVFERHERQLAREATVDQLTDALNRSAFSERADRQLRRCQRDRRPVSVLVLDLDHFKEVNDRHGHDAGDALLRAFARLARAELRPSDLLGRAGGEEFWALLPSTALPEACLSARRIGERFRNLHTSFEGRDIRATVSIGVAEVSLQDEGVARAIIRADRALYDAKRLGRDRVIAAETPSLQPQSAPA